MQEVQQIRVGECYQADIPALLSPEEQVNKRRHDAPLYRPKWTPNRFSEEEVSEYLSSYSRLHETELSVHCLYECDFDVNKAVVRLLRARKEKAAKARTYRYSKDDEALKNAVMTHGKKFHVIKQSFPHATTRDMVRRFYDWKTSTSYLKWRALVKVKKSKEAEQLRQWSDDAGDESDWSDFHNEYCELCFTGGQLLCCDGCERAYHFSCVDPPVKDVPMGDWFCDQCAIVLGTRLITRTSVENAFVEETIVGDSQLSVEVDEEVN